MAAPAQMVCFSPSSGSNRNAVMQRAADGARGVHRVQQPDAPADLRFFRHGVTRQDGQRRPHERGGQRQRCKRAQQIERRRADMIAVGRRRLSAEHREQPGICQRQQQGNREHGAARNAELEQRVGEHRTRDARQKPFHQPGAERETPHIGGENRGHGELGSAKHDRELARPGGLIDEGGDATQHETSGQQEQGCARGALLIDSLGR